MALSFVIENRANLPDGGPMDFIIHGKRGADIGRDLHLDWSLPDPSRVVSSKHCEVRFRDGGYWLTDVSTNGTFLNGQTFRMQGPHRLRNGDRLEIGPYIINVLMDDAENGQSYPASTPSPPPAAFGDPWSGFRSEAPPQAISSPPPPPDANSMNRGDAMDWFADIPAPDLPAPPPRRDETWMRALMAGAKAPEPPKVETPVAAVTPSPPQPAPPVMPMAGLPDGWGGPPVMPMAQMPVAQDPPQPFVLPPPVPAPARPLEGPRPATLPPEAMHPYSAPSMPTAAPMAMPIAPAKPAVTPATPAPPMQPVPPPQAPRQEPQPFERAPRHAGSAVAAEMSGDQFLELIARGAGVPSDVFRQLPPERVAEIIGAMLRVTLDDLRAQLQIRAQAKGMVRSTNQTTIQAFENNPLKFTPTAEEALRKMLAPPGRSYLPAVEALQQSFSDLKTHQMNTYSAMQQALKMVVDDLDPAAIERATEADGGLGGFMQNRKAKLWETYTTRWKAKTARHDNGFVDVFLIYFSESYDAQNRKLK